MKRTFTIVAVSAIALLTGGCQTQPGALRPENNTSVYSLHQPVVERTDYVFDVNTSGDGVSAAERERLNDWFRTIDLRYGDNITIDEAEGFSSTAARQDISRVVAQYGMRVSTDAAPMTDGAVPAGTVRVVASRSRATVPDCPTWSNPGVASTAATSPNYGCALNSNLAAMVADPNDLVLGQDGSVRGSGSTAARAIRVYREGQPTGRQGLPASSGTSNR